MTFPILGGNGAVTGAYSIDNSLKFNDDDSAYLTRTPSSAGNRKTWTWSAWVKRGNLSTTQKLFMAYGANNEGGYTSIDLDPNSFRVTGYASAIETTTAVLRDVSAWYHLMVVFDTTQATEANRVKMYINGEQAATSQGGSHPAQNFEPAINNNVIHAIGARYTTSATGEFLDGYMAEVHFIDGTAKAPTDFGEFDSTSGIWKPIEYEGTYGTNGFYLDFEDSSSLGNDVSGNNNDFTATNLASTDQTTDTPTNNFAIMSSIHPSSSNFTVSEGNLKIARTGTGNYGLYSQSLMPTSGKWYFEVKIITRGSSDRTSVGIANFESVTGTGVIKDNYSGVEISTAASDKIFITENGTTTENETFYTALSDNDIVRFAVDMDNGRLYLGVNGNWWNYSSSQTGGDPTSGSGYVTNSTTIFNGSPMTAYSGFSAGISTSTNQEFNFGNPPFSISSGNSDGNGYGNFEYAVPSGYLALCTQNLATELSPTIDDGSEYFDILTYTGTGSTQSITGLDFKPDWVWIKKRNSAAYHQLFDSVRGATKGLFSNTDDDEAVDSGNLQSFISGGFTADGFGGTNGSGDTYVAWNWLASNTTVSNTDGSTTSTVSVNQTAGFSVVTYTGTGSNTTIGHGLGKVPAMMIVKKRTGANDDWAVYHNGVLTPANARYHYMRLNTTSAYAGDGTYWNDTAPTTSVFTVGTNADVNTSGHTYVAYIFTDIEGYSKMGKFSGNSSLDGPMIYTGFSTKWLMYKNITSATDWMILDDKRIHNASNAQLDYLEPNTNDAEGDMRLEFLSNGFKLREGSESGAKFNLTGETYIYMAFASNPFVDSNGIPVTAR